MLHVAIPFTDEVVFNPAEQVEEIVVNRFDEVRGAIHINVKSFHVEGIAVYMIKLKCPESALISAKMTRAAWLMNFTLNGELNISGVNSLIDMIAKTGTHHSLIPVTTGSFDMIIQGDVTLFVVGLSNDIVSKLLTQEEEVTLKQILNVIPARATTSAMSGILAAVKHCAENNCLHRIFLAAKMLELLFLDIEQLKGMEEAMRPVVRTEDLEKLQLARTLIAKDIQSPCSLIELAHKVGLNDFKLKKGFKEAFGTTVFGHLYDLRMEKAKAMLATARYTISDVAHEIGYKNAHHFTAAFKKKYGYLPSRSNR